MAKDQLDEVESFLSKASFVMFTNVEKDMLMQLIFEEKELASFKDTSNFIKVRELLRGRNLTLSIAPTPGYYRATLIDKDNSEVININNAKFVTDNLEHFINAVPTDIKMIFSMICFANETKISEPFYKDSEAIIVHGYSYKFE